MLIFIDLTWLQYHWGGEGAGGRCNDYITPLTIGSASEMTNAGAVLITVHGTDKYTTLLAAASTTIHTHITLFY